MADWVKNKIRDVADDVPVTYTLVVFVLGVVVGTLLV